MRKKPLILVIDDLKSNRMIVKKILKSDFDFIEASDGLEALETLKQYTPDIILIDAIMPNLDGFETIKMIREITKYKTTPILMITSLNDTKIKINALENGVNDFLTKPFDQYELKARCKSYMKMVKLNKQYLDTQINHVTKYKNKQAFTKELLPNDGIFLFAINDFQKLDGIYGYKNSKLIEKKYADMLDKLAKDYLENATLYHISIGKFVIKTSSDKKIEDDKLEYLCKTFYDTCNDTTIQFDDISFTPVSTIIYTKDRINLYEDAMSALSYAKKHNIPYIYCSDDINGIKDLVYSNINILKNINTAINSNNIINYYQPIYDNEKEKITKYETLVRIKSENNQIIPPNIFLETAKDAKIYEKITKIVYKNAFDMFKFNNIEFSINISNIDIENKNIREYIFDILQKNPHVSNKITFELQNNTQSYDIGLLKHFIKEIKNNDAKIALDNFGKDSMDIKDIIDTNPDYLKLDGNLVKNILTDSKCYNLLESLNEFSHNLGIKTIASYVSSKEIFNEITNIGIDFSQGYYIGKPSVKLADSTIVV